MKPDFVTILCIREQRHTGVDGEGDQQSGAAPIGRTGANFTPSSEEIRSDPVKIPLVRVVDQGAGQGGSGSRSSVAWAAAS